MRAPLIVEAPAAQDAAECAACHGPIQPGEATHTCVQCNAQHHADCWTENRGCATYGCSEVGVLDRTDEALAGDAIASEHRSPIDTQSDWAVLTLAGLAGLPSFGVTSLAAGAWLMMRSRRSQALVALVLGIAGAVASGVWWLGWWRIRE
ncbi:MAG: hypothetical protein QM770_20715 [Tepidisphaeraceae bacterium]